MRSWRCQTVRTPKATEAGTEGRGARLGGGQTEASMVAMMDAAGKGFVAAGGAFKTLWQREERSKSNLALVFPEANRNHMAQRVLDVHI